MNGIFKNLCNNLLKFCSKIPQNSVNYRFEKSRLNSPSPDCSKTPQEWLEVENKIAAC